MHGKGRITTIRGDAAHLPLPDSSVDLIVTSPPFWALRSYTDGGKHYDGQVGSELSAAEYIATLIECTREWCRVLKPAGSLFIELGDKYVSGGGKTGSGKPKSLMGLPWRYALACIDQLGLILRAEIVWNHVNGLPESVRDRVRRGHSTMFHLVKQPRYYSAIDEIRESYRNPAKNYGPGGGHPQRVTDPNDARAATRASAIAGNPLGKLPSSVWDNGPIWDIASQPLRTPVCRLVWDGVTIQWFTTWEDGQKHMCFLAQDQREWDQHQGRPSLRPEADHFAAWPMEVPRRVIWGWSPPGVCTTCGEGRRPVSERTTGSPPTSKERVRANGHSGYAGYSDSKQYIHAKGAHPAEGGMYAIIGYACACPDTTAPTRPAVVLDPFGGTGSTALIATALGRNAISLDMSHDYCRLARWRIQDHREVTRALARAASLSLASHITSRPPDSVLNVAASAGRDYPPMPGKTQGDQAMVLTMPPVCVCGCPEDVHWHYRSGSDCGRCGPDVCARYMRNWRMVWLVMRSEIAAACPGFRWGRRSPSRS